MNAEPLRVAFEVEVSPERAFELWTTRCASWWPRSHTMSGDPAAITFEPRAGGSIVEYAHGGRAHRWGEILEWEPPSRLRYSWHPFFEPSEATEVEVTFTQIEGGTAVRLEQRGFERLGEQGTKRRERTTQAWSTIMPLFVQACREPGSA